MTRFRLHACLAVVALSLLAGAALSTAPTPLYPAYSKLLGLTAAGITALFAIFAVGAIIGLLVIAPLLVRRGRRALFVTAASTQALASAVLALFPSVAGFAAGRVLAGIGVGMLASSVTAMIRELAATGPDSRFARGVVMIVPGLSLAGLALGPIIAGAIAPAAPGELSALYGGFAAVLVVAAAAGLLLPRPESAPVRAQRGAAVPVRSLLGAFLSFSTTGLFGALAPTFLARIDPEVTPAIVGAAVGAIFLSGAVVPLVVGSRPRLLRPIVGLTALVAGLGGVVLALLASSSPLFVASGMLAGGGSGIVFTLALRDALAAVPLADSSRAASHAFAAAYLGLAVPVVIAGALVGVVPAWGIALLFVVEALVIAAILTRRWTRGGAAIRE